ncbi:hypothetical protein DAT35_54400 [Vitiosangium sp. GDMCC 1.1324]|nr:hypothetical protein DAT35_54400 [Vitiosangium sp. GDMCC 1.1324]
MLVGSAAVCALVFAFVRLALMSQPPSSRDFLVVTEPTPQSHEVPTDTWGPLTELSLLSATDGGLPVLSRLLPSKPYHGQKRPPCKPRVEVEINGGCWVPHMLNLDAAPADTPIGRAVSGLGTPSLTDALQSDDS